MKKTLSFVALTLALILFGAFAYAEPIIDFSDYSLEELIQIKADLMDELLTRPGGEGTVLGSGQYKIGEDFPSGVYAIKFVQNSDSDRDYTDYYIYENESMYKYDLDRMWLGDMSRDDGELKGDSETRISLYPGECLALRRNSAEFVRVGNTAELDHGDYEPPEGTSIPKGNYLVGDEIPAGTYKVYFGGTTTARVRVFEDEDEASNSFNKGKQTVLDWNNTESTVTLNEGNIFRVEYTSIIMTKDVGFTFD